MLHSAGMLLSPFSTCRRLACQGLCFHVCQQHGKAGTNTWRYQVRRESILPAQHGDSQSQMPGAVDSIQNSIISFDGQQ